VYTHAETDTHVVFTLRFLYISPSWCRFVLEGFKKMFLPLCLAFGLDEPLVLEDVLYFVGVEGVIEEIAFWVDSSC